MRGSGVHTRLSLLARRCRRDEAEEGFTLIELVIVLVLMPMVIAAVAIVVITTFKATDSHDPRGTLARLTDSHDAQINSAYFVRDVQTAQYVSTNAAPLCAPSGAPNHQVLGLRWASGSTQINVSYFALSSPAQLVRYFCSGGSSPPTTTSVISHNVFSAFASGTAAIVTCSGALGTGASICAGDPAGPTTYLATTVSCGNGTNSCGSGGPYPVSGTFGDGVSNTDTSWRSSSAGFTAADVGKAISGAFIPSGTTIASVTNSTTVVLSKPTTGTGTNLPFTLSNRGVQSVQMAVSESRSGFPYALRASPRNAGAAGGASGGGPLLYSPFLVNGSASLGNCKVLVNGIAASNDTSGTAIGSGPQGNLNATGAYTAGGSVTNPPYSGTTSTGNPLPSPYSGLSAPPTVPGGASYGIVTINTHNWDPSTDATYLVNGNQLRPNIYIVTNGMSISKGLNATNGVLFYVTGGNVVLGGIGNVILSALTPNWESPVTNPPPPTVPEPVLWISSSDSGATLTLGGNGSISTQIDGAIYAPTTAVTMNGGGSTGGIDVLGMNVGSIAACNGGGSVTWNIVAGSKQASGTVDGPTSPSITLGQSNTDSVVVQGIGSLNPTGQVTVYVCGPSIAPTTCTSTSTSVGSVSLTPGPNGTATATSPAFTPSAPGTWCFAASYPGDTSYNASSDTSTDGCFTVNAPTIPPAPTVVVPGLNACYYTSGTNNPPPGCSAWGNSMSGTATDPGGPGLSNVKIAIQAPNGKYWNGTSFVTSGTAIMNTTALTGPSGGSWSWTYGFAASKFAAKGTYTVLVTSTDTTNQTSVPATVTFTWNG